MIELQQVSLTTAAWRSPQHRSNLVAQPVLQDLNLTFPAGQIVGIVGANGAGKTSLLKLLNRLVDPSQGQLQFQGKPYGDIDPQALRQQIRLVLQEPQLLGLTVADAIVQGLQIQSPNAIDRTAVRSRWCERLQIPADWLPLTATGLALGQQQWVSIARTIACEPPVLLLDEPTAHLDLTYRDKLSHVLRRLMQASTPLIVIVSHDWQWLSQIADRVIHLQAGRVTQDALTPTLDWTKLAAALQAEQQALAETWA
jgi:D-methionine transport system ATP-binding protein